MLKLIVGLGNPGAKYEETRHNLGFKTVRAFAQKHGLNWTLERRFKSEVARGEGCLLLLPHTYMNLSGEAVQKVVHYHKIPLEGVLVVLDEVYLPLGKMRLRARGSAGGHNGLDSIERALGTQEYARLRMGVGPKENGSDFGGPLEEYVLGLFTAEEKQDLPALIERGSSAVECWLAQGVEAAARMASNETVRNDEREKPTLRRGLHPERNVE